MNGFNFFPASFVTEDRASDGGASPKTRRTADSQLKQMRTGIPAKIGKDLE